MFDRGLQFGDGCFTTILVVKNRAVLLYDHIFRLMICVRKLYLNVLNWEKIINDLNYLSRLNTKELGVIKVIITRGESNRGYKIVCNKSTVIMTLSDYPVLYLNKRKVGMDLVLSKIPINDNPYLSKIKHLNRLEQVLIKREIDYFGVDEAIVFDRDGFLISCCASNIFFVKEKCVFTPDLNNCGVQGIMRKKIIKYLLKKNYNVFFIKITLDFLEYFDEMFITNSLMPILPVNKIFLFSKKRKIIFFSRKIFNFLLPYCLDLI